MKTVARFFSDPMPAARGNLPGCAGPGLLPGNRDQELLSVRVHRFGRRLKSRGVPVTLSGVRDALRSLLFVDPTRKADFEIALRANLIFRKEDLALFHNEFEYFWHSLDAPESQEPPEGLEVGQHLETADAEGGEEHFSGGPKRAGWHFSRAELLAEKDFQDWREEERPEVFRWLEQEIRPLIQRSSLRYRISRRGPNLEIRKTLRQSLRAGGDFRALAFRRKKVKSRRLIFLADVSGSMEPYGRVFFLFLRAWLKAPFPVDAFAFSTRLTHLTPLIKSSRMEDLGEVVSAHVPQWSGGTRIGESLDQFVRGAGKKLLGTRSLVLVFSDGWDLGEPEVLRQALRRIRRRSHKILWLNPLMGCADYQPICRGMAAALPLVDKLLPAHSLKSLSGVADNMKYLIERGF